MISVCIDKGEIEDLTERQEPSLMDIYIRLNELERENEILKANNYELQKENMQLRNDNILLHNRLNKNSQYTTLVDGNDDDLSYMDEYAKGNKELEEELAKAYKTTGDDYKFGGHDLKEL